uniref:Photosynthetic NDH subunit of lumenal location 2, chloroplastic n=1 Tax=Ananas comosus var. bracteatus TaxID=296719 RepID=A0A6V7P321_ANACO|nr:unnamed protein product [Ananas comosus var. bracteatus]
MLNLRAHTHHPPPVYYSPLPPFPLSNGDFCQTPYPLPRLTLLLLLLPGHRRSSGDRAPSPGAGPGPARASRRWAVASTVLGAAAAPRAAAGGAAPAEAAEMAWGTRSFIKEKYFQPGLSPEEAAARIRHTAEGLRDMRHMLDTMSWRYVLFYVRLKAAYLDADLKNALATVPRGAGPPTSKPPTRSSTTCPSWIDMYVLQKCMNHISTMRRLSNHWMS